MTWRPLILWVLGLSLGGCASVEPIARFPAPRGRVEIGIGVVASDRFVLASGSDLLEIGRRGIARAPLPCHPGAISANGSVVASPASAGGWDVVDLETGAVHTFGQEDVAFPCDLLELFPAVALSPDGSAVAYARKGAVHVFSVADGRLLASFGLQTRPGTSLAFSPDGRRIACCVPLTTQAGAVYVFDLGSKAPVVRYTQWFRGYAQPTFSPDGRIFAVPSGKEVLLFHLGPPGARPLEDLEETDSLPAEVSVGMEIGSLAVARDGHVFVGSADDPSIRVFEPAAGHEVGRLEALASGVTRVLLSRDGGLVLAGTDSTLAVLDARSGEVVRAVASISTRIQRIEHRGRTLAVAREGAPLCIHDRVAGALVAVERRRASEAAPRGELASPDGEVVAREMNTVWCGVFDARTGARLWQAESTSWPARFRFAFSRDGARVAVSRSSGLLDVRDSRTGEVLCVLREASCFVPEAVALSFSPDGSELACGLANGSVEVYSVR